MPNRGTTHGLPRLCDGDGMYGHSLQGTLRQAQPRRKTRVDARIFAIPVDRHHLQTEAFLHLDFLSNSAWNVRRPNRSFA
jgi:hypothetical protein